MLSKGKKNFKAGVAKKGGLDDESATQYERLLAVVHLLSSLDVWRRNTSHQLTPSAGPS